MSVVVFAVTLDGTSMCICNCGFAMVYLQWLQWCLCWMAYLHMYLSSVSDGHICYKHVLSGCGEG